MIPKPLPARFSSLQLTAPRPDQPATQPAEPRHSVS